MERYVFNSRARAEAVLDWMGSFIDLYGVVTREDLKRFYGIASEPKDSSFGWMTLEKAYIETDMCRLEFVLVLPKATPIK